MEEILKIENVYKYYGTQKLLTKALNGLSFNVCKGDYIGIIGTSGSGKTTLLNCISSIDSVTKGNVYFGGKNLKELSQDERSKFRRNELGFVFQDFKLLETLTAFENIAFSLTLKGINKKFIKDKVTNIASRLGINNKTLNKFPSQLSGGQQQKVAIARAIVTEPTLILADEPTGALDSGASKKLLECFLKLNQEVGATILVVTHDILVASYCQKVLFLKDGKLFSRINRGEDSRKTFLTRISDTIALMEGDIEDV
jgi:putative ABC transport system ATP-binding protein